MTDSDDPRGLLMTGLPGRLWEHLRTDGGWLTVEGIEIDFPSEDDKAVRRSLLRLRAKGLAVNRPRLITEKASHEWKALLPQP